MIALLVGYYADFISKCSLDTSSETSERFYCHRFFICSKVVMLSYLLCYCYGTFYLLALFYGNIILNVAFLFFYAAFKKLLQRCSSNPA